MAEPRKVKFNFEALRIGATSADPKTRKKAFENYFEQFEEFPSFLFDNSQGVDARLSETIRDLEKDPETSKLMRRGLELLLNRLPDMPERA